ncbi:ABC transporter substrate-binding protein [Streptomyces sp. NPDC058657]|uniref:ABC transporter substrate-binding protein n=1 Tax=unclassified Streptomyces TaxID=2593676 RepID=UPI00364F5A1C
MLPAFSSRPVRRVSHSFGRGASALAVVVSAVFAAGCAPQPEPAAGASPGASAAKGGSCEQGKLPTETAGKLTVGTDKPAYAPWFKDDKPDNGQGYESAVAYAIAGKLGFKKQDVVWQTVAFNNAFAPGEKKFDLDLNQISISEQRKKAVDFSSGYYDVRQTVVALKNSKAAKAKTVADLKDVKLGAQVGTTSLDVINEVIKPAEKPAVYQKNDLAKAALKNGQVDGIVVDLPTAFYITGAEVPEAAVIGQFADTLGKAEQFGAVLDKGSALTPCVSGAVDALRKDGTLAKLEKQWLADAVDAPVLK